MAIGLKYNNFISTWLNLYLLKCNLKAGLWTAEFNSIGY